MPSTLAIHLDRARGEPLYRQIERQLRAAILDGRLRPRTLLPGVRTLAGQLGVARITIVTAYEQLTAEGLLEARVGSGTRVAADPGLVREPSSPPAIAARSPRPPARPAVVRTPEIDLRPGGIAVDEATAGAWEGLLRAAWRESAGATRPPQRGYDPAGDTLLRSLVAERIGATRGVRCTGAEVVIASGRHAALGALSDLVLPRSAPAIVEDPAERRAAAVLDAAGARLLPVPTDARGLRTELLPAAAAMARVTPAWQEVSGGTLSLDRRLDLVAWASRSGALLIEDDTGGELRLRGPLTPALASMDPAGSIVLIDGIGELLFEGLALGVVIAPAGLAARLAARLDLLGRVPARVEQRALARMFADGHVDRHLRRLRQRMIEGQAALVDALEDQAIGLLRAAPAPAGRHLVVTVIDPTISARSAAARAASHGVLVAPLAAARRLGGGDRDLLIGYAAETPERIREGVRRLVAALDRRTSTLRNPRSPGLGRPGPGDRPLANAGPIVPRLAAALD